ncbi:DUF7146 domain-containing protein [Tabrizicola sp. BL-A-41-H6]|uniref:DUF7146 domain-containing protein n=1 Tax=Tabrizicola sp. BL-A-41-H6 TaxID=3421107 RepID=UPI003D670301
MRDARALTLVAGGRWFGHYGTAPCPICQPERRSDQNALSLSEGSRGQLLAHCKKEGCKFATIIAALGGDQLTGRSPTSKEIERRIWEERLTAERNGAFAARIWGEAIPILGTPGETYLRRRGITCDIPTTLRFHPNCWHRAIGKGHPAMIARVERGCGVAIHRTWLAADGSSKASVNPPRAMLGALAGGAVRLVDGREGLAVAEGVETALSLASGLLAAPVSIWAALSASGLASLELPEEVGTLIVATDGDSAGTSSGQKLAERASRLGWKVSMLPAAEGTDWNDVLQAGLGASL